ncbi:MAG: M48 family metallopeptidase [Kiritimatiellaeota bacterium]|nr:M48 family metallopeptidase [Kiritimatiellota bacterium]
MTDSSPSTAEPAARQEQARAYESLQNKLFAVRLLITVLALAAYLFSGASVRLAAGLATWFGGGWPLVNGVYLLVTIFGFAAVSFPLALFEDHVLEHRYGLSRQTLGEWLWDYAKSLALELALGLVFFEVLYALLRWSPQGWWAFGAVFYILFAVVLTAIAPVVIMPLFHKFEPLQNNELVALITQFVQRAGLQVIGVYRWGLAEKTATANAALAGLGRTRRIILGDTLLHGYTPDEILAVLAHEVGHYRHRDLFRLLTVGAGLATLGFYIAHRLLHTLVAAAGFASVADIGSFPLFVFCLFVFSLVALPFNNAYSRRREYAADAYAVAALGAAGPLVSAFEKLAAQNLDDKHPPAWIEFLLYSHPSIARRMARAQAVERRLPASAAGSGPESP